MAYSKAIIKKICDKVLEIGRDEVSSYIETDEYRFSCGVAEIGNFAGAFHGAFDVSGIKINKCGNPPKLFNQIKNLSKTVRFELLVEWFGLEIKKTEDYLDSLGYPMITAVTSENDGLHQFQAEAAAALEKLNYDPVTVGFNGTGNQVTLWCKVL